MYLAHYGLAEPPFSITPDPRFVHLGERHRDALAHLRHGIDTGGGGGFVQLTGEVGTGKTTLLRLLLSQLPDDTRVALVLNPRLGATELLESICEELGIDVDGRRGSPKALVDALNARLLDAYAEGLRVVLVIDEAQVLPVDALEQVRLLTNLETDTQKLLQVLLLGQPELRALLARDDLRQLAQRITARFHLTPLDAAESGDYLRHRFRVAGGSRFPFTPAAVARLHARAGGVPRLLNAVAGRALLAGYARDAHTLDVALVEEAADEVLPPRAAAIATPTALRGARWPALAGVGLLLAAVIGGGGWLRGRAGTDTGATTAGAASDAAATTRGAPARARTGAAPSAGATPAVPTAPSPPPIDADAFGSRIVAASARGGAAWTPLLRAWDLPSSPADADAAAGCAVEIAPGVYCVRARASLDRLLATARPALLRLRSEGREAWALLRGGDAGHARLWLDGSEVAVARLALDGTWNGDHVVLWRGPAALVIPARDGDRGATVGWIAARLAEASASSPPRAAVAAADEVVFDGAMRDALLRLQRARGLAADGVAGPETMLVLADTLPGPRLDARAP